MQRNKRKGDSADTDSEFGARTYWKSMKKSTHKEDRRTGKLYSKNPLYMKPEEDDDEDFDDDEYDDFEKIGAKGKVR